MGYERNQGRPAGDRARRVTEPDSERRHQQAAGSPYAALRALQQTAGNRATAALVQRLNAPTGVQRDPEVAEEPAAEEVSVAGVALSADKVSVPLGTAVTATASPANATGVVYSLENSSVEPTNVAIGADDGVITVAAGQQGGEVNVVATASDGSGALQSLRLVEPPTAVASTSASGGDDYGGQFVHTFSAPSGESSGLEGGNVNESFESLEAAPPWGGTFALAANAAGSHGWDLDSAGAMTGPDNVDIEASSVDIGPLIHSASNPNPTAAMPQGFTMTQSLYAKSFPENTLAATPFATVDHTRQLIAGGQFEVSAGMDSVIEDYSGPAAVTGAVASPATVMASAPRPADGEGEWEQNKVAVTATAIPSDAALTYSFVGPELGCSVDADGEVSIGTTAGTVTVRALASTSNYDEVTITITTYVAPAEGESESGEPEAPAPAPGADTPDS